MQEATQPRRQWLILPIVAGVAVLYALAFPVERAPKAVPVAPPSAGSTEAHATIAKSLDCAGLQVTFDRNMDQAEARRPGDPLRAATMAYARTADKRMRDLGCYR